MKEYFKVTPDYSGAMEKHYKISIGTGKTHIAFNLEEVAYALQHYFDGGFLNIEHDKVQEKCPFCRDKKAEW